ncbi:MULTISPECIES: TetR/AcrR family transcriptional regulator [unclassified Schlesneria]|uniref:TetR/AcrR family transcriptional regulator n=1 Tax=unclassified Schlesneria TaxID=2762017 RepID=UPI002F03A5A6
MTEVRKRQRRKEARPQEILAAAVSVFTEKGFAAAQVQEIATRAGVAKGTVYLYYKTKQEIFEEIVRANVSPVFSKLNDLLHVRQGSAADLLCVVLESLYRELVDVPDRRVVIKVLISEGGQFPELVEFYYREVLQFAEKLLRTLLENGRDAGEFRACPALLEPRVVVGPVILASVWRMTFEKISPLDLPKFVKAHLDLVLNGLLIR